MNRRCGYSARHDAAGTVGDSGMMHTNPIGFAALGLLLATVAGLAGCQRSDTEATPATAGGPAAHASAAPSVDAGVASAMRTMAAGVRMGAGNAPVEVRFELSSVPVQGQPFEVDVAVLPQATTPVLRIAIEGGSGLSLLAPAAPVAIEKVQAGSVEHVTVRATSTDAGTRVLTVKVTFDFPAGAESRDFAFPLIVGAASAPDPVPAKAPAKQSG